MRLAIRNKLIYTAAALAAAIAIVGPSRAQEARTPDLPAECARISVPAGNRFTHHVYATGVQVYAWSNTSGWRLVGPVANLYADPGFNGQVGRHYAGPTWESNSGGFVVAKKVDECSPDTNSIAWLLLKADRVGGAGGFSNTSFIQRLNTAAGKAPSRAGLFEGEEVRIPYTTEYFFYRAIGPREDVEN